MMMWIDDPQCRIENLLSVTHKLLTLHGWSIRTGAPSMRDARGFEAFHFDIRWSGVVGNNLAARLDHVRADALYARVLFVFLGLPGVILAGLLTLAVAGSGSQRRQREQALLRTRGASVAVVLRLSASEAAAVGFGGTVLGLTLTWIALASGLLGPALAWNGHVLWWVAGACLGGLCLAAAAVLYPACSSNKRCQSSTGSRRTLSGGACGAAPARRCVCA